MELRILPFCRWSKLFGDAFATKKDKMLLLSVEEFLSSPKTTYEKICAFLCLPSNVQYSINTAGKTNLNGLLEHYKYLVPNRNNYTEEMDTNNKKENVEEQRLHIQHQERAAFTPYISESVLR